MRITQADPQPGTPKADPLPDVATTTSECISAERTSTRPSWLAPRLIPWPCSSSVDGMRLAGHPCRSSCSQESKMNVSRNLFFRAVLLTAGLASASVASAASPDSAFVKEAAAGGVAEVDRGKLAQEKASNDQVKQFGSRMVQDHSKANDELKQVAGVKGVQLPAGPDAKAQAEMKKMQ